MWMWLIKSCLAWLKGGSGGAVGEGQEEQGGVSGGSQSRKFKWRSGRGNQSPSRRSPTKHVPLNEVRAWRQAPTSDPLTSVRLGKGHAEARLPRRLACFTLRGRVFFSFFSGGKLIEKIPLIFWRFTLHFVFITEQGSRFFFFNSFNSFGQCNESLYLWSGGSR